MSVGRRTAAGLLVLAMAGCAGRPTRPEVSLPPPPAPAPPTLPAISVAQHFIEAALAMQGEPYLYGGDSPGGFDCSGLVAYAAKRAGIAVPRTAHEQFKAGVEIAREAMQPGDLVFMRLKRELHVGIVVAPGRFVHAPSSGGHVRIDQLDSRPYRDGLVAIRRLQP